MIRVTFLDREGKRKRPQRPHFIQEKHLVISLDIVKGRVWKIIPRESGACFDITSAEQQAQSPQHKSSYTGMLRVEVGSSLKKEILQKKHQKVPPSKVNRN